MADASTPTQHAASYTWTTAGWTVQCDCGQRDRGTHSTMAGAERSYKLHTDAAATTLQAAS